MITVVFQGYAGPDLTRIHEIALLYLFFDSGEQTIQLSIPRLVAQAILQLLIKMPIHRTPLEPRITAGIWDKDRSASYPDVT